MIDTAPAVRLPRGRHGIPREEVLASQRGRLLRAMTEAVAEKGFARTAVADVLARAAVSRSTFYEHFTDRDECFLAALDAAAGLLSRQLAEAATTAEPARRLEVALAAYLDALAVEPAAARAFLIEVFAAPPPALERRVAMLERFTTLVCELVGASGEEERFRCEAFVGSVSSLATMRVAAGRAASLPGLHGPLVALAQDLFASGEAR